MADSQKHLQALTEQFQNLQKGWSPAPPTSSPVLTRRFLDLTSVVEARQKLESQLQENKAVQKVQLLSTPTRSAYSN